MKFLSIYIYILFISGQQELPDGKFQRRRIPRIDAVVGDSFG